MNILKIPLKNTHYSCVLRFLFQMDSKSQGLLYEAIEALLCSGKISRDDAEIILAAHPMAVSSIIWMIMDSRMRQSIKMTDRATFTVAEAFDKRAALHGRVIGFAIRARDAATDNTTVTACNASMLCLHAGFVCDACDGCSRCCNCNCHSYIEDEFWGIVPVELCSDRGSECNCGGFCFECYDENTKRWKNLPGDEAEKCAGDEEEVPEYFDEDSDNDTEFKLWWAHEQSMRGW